MAEMRAALTVYLKVGEMADAMVVTMADSLAGLMDVTWVAL